MEAVAAAHPLWWVLSLVLMAVGVAGTVLPVLPGTILVFAGAALGAWIDGFEKVSGGALAFIAVLALLAFATDWVAALLGAKRAGASRLAVIGAGVGTVLGVLTGFIGLLFMPLVGAMAGEWWSRRSANGGVSVPGDEAAAARVGVATWIGLLLGTVVKVVLTFLMIGSFAVAYLV